MLDFTAFSMCLLCVYCVFTVRLLCVYCVFTVSLLCVGYASPVKGFVTFHLLQVSPNTLHKLPCTRHGTRLEGFMMQYTNYRTRNTRLEGLMNCSPTSACVFGILAWSCVCVDTPVDVKGRKHPSLSTVGGRNPAPVIRILHRHPSTPSLILESCSAGVLGFVPFPKSCTTSCFSTLDFLPTLKINIK